MASLCVNIDHVATLRQARGGQDPDPAAAVAAFQRRWRPDMIDGMIDGECRAILFRLLLDRDEGRAR